MINTDKYKEHTANNGLCLKKDMSHCSQWYFEDINKWTPCECSGVIE